MTSGGKSCRPVVGVEACQRMLKGPGGPVGKTPQNLGPQTQRKRMGGKTKTMRGWGRLILSDNPKPPRLGNQNDCSSSFQRGVENISSAPASFAPSTEPGWRCLEPPLLC